MSKDLKAWAKPRGFLMEGTTFLAKGTTRGRGAGGIARRPIWPEWAWDQILRCCSLL